MLAEALEGRVLLSASIIQDANTVAQPVVDVGGAAYYTTHASATSLRTQLWRSNGTPGGTVVVRDVRPGGNSNGPFSASPAELTDVNGTLFFTADDGVHGRELWRFT